MLYIVQLNTALSYYNKLNKNVILLRSCYFSATAQLQSFEIFHANLQPCKNYAKITSGGLWANLTLLFTKD